MMKKNFDQFIKKFFNQHQNSLSPWSKIVYMVRGSGEKIKKFQKASEKLSNYCFEAGAKSSYSKTRREEQDSKYCALREKIEKQNC
jgi:hypothetical protein